MSRSSTDNSESTRSKILAGAMTVFAEQGTRVPVQQILEEADVSRRTFYRSFPNLEAVMLALYEFGTEFLMQRCRESVERCESPAEVLAGCIDAHLAGVSMFGRLIYILGGEAQSPDSPLYARRMSTHRTLADLMRKVLADDLPEHCDPLLVGSLLIALESIARTCLRDEGRRVDAVVVDSARAVMMRLATATLLAPAGGEVTPLPRV